MPSAEKDATPEQVGYSEPWPVTEYGVFEDRRSKGLGFALVKTTEDREYADRLLVEVGYPRFLRTRTVVYQPWSLPLPPGEGK